jgi:endonuclease/exonuclease/phosphatase family metal-dependent hydrolase
MLRPGEQRGLLQLTLDVRGHELLFLATHIDYRPDDSERTLNVGEIREAVRQQPGRPTMVCGDFNDVPSSRTHSLMKEAFNDSWELAGQGDGFTFSATKPNKRIDYIWISKEPAIAAVRLWVPQTDASDHLPLAGEFQLR